MKRRFAKSLTAFTAVAAMLLGGLPCAVTDVSAWSAPTYTIVTRLDESIFSKETTTYTITWDDKIFLKPADSTYSHELAKACIVLSTAAYRNSVDKNRTQYIDRALEQLGFRYDELKSYNYDKDKSNDTVGYTFGHKTITNDGVKSELVIVVVRGTPPTDEWKGNFNVGNGTVDGFVHINFKRAEEDLVSNLINYTSNNSALKGKPFKILITGHSRGGAIANILAKDVVEGDHNLQVPISDVFAYTFAAPNTVIRPTKKYNNIYNFINEDDFVPQVPLSEWGYTKYGNTYKFPVDKYSAFETVYNRLDSKVKFVPYGKGVLSKLLKSMYEAAPSVKAYYDDQHGVAVGLKQSGYDYFVNQVSTLLQKNSVFTKFTPADALIQSANYPNSKLSPISAFFMGHNKEIAFAHSSTSYIAWMYSLGSDWITAPKPAPSAAPVVGINSINKDMVVNAGGPLPFYETVSVSGKKTGDIPNGTTVFVYGKTTQAYEKITWAKIRYNNADGWVNADKLKDAEKKPEPPKLTVKSTTEGSYVVTVPANYKLDCYQSAASTTVYTNLSAKSSSYALNCTKRLSMSDGSTRYFFVSGDNKNCYFTFTSKMSVTQPSKPTEPEPVSLPKPYVMVSGSNVSVSWSKIPNSSQLDVYLVLIDEETTNGTRVDLVSAKSVTSANFRNLSDGNYSVRLSTNVYTRGEIGERTSFKIGGQPAVSITKDPPKAGTVTIKYNANGGTGAPSSQSVTKDSGGNIKFTVPTTKPTMSDSTFIGWVLDNNRSNNTVLPGDSVSVNVGGAEGNSTLTYYASWLTLTIVETPIYIPRK